MNDRRPYDGDSYGRQPNPPGPGGRGPGRSPAPRAGHGDWDTPPPRPVDPRPAPRPAGPPPEQRPYPDPRPAPPGRGGFEPKTGQWDDDEGTQMIGKLGFVPPEARHPDEPLSSDFDTDRVTAADRNKFRARRRAKKASPLAKVGVAAIALVVVAGIGGGVWWLVSGDDEPADDGLTYAAVEKPCEPMDLGALSSVDGSDQVNEMRNEVDAKKHKTTQVCEVTLGKDGASGNVQIYAEVFPRNAGAENAFQHGAADAEEAASDTIGYAPVDGVADGAFAVPRTSGGDSKTVDYSLYLYDDNAFLYTRLALYDGTSQDQVAGYVKTIAESYLTSWKG